MNEWVAEILQRGSRLETPPASKYPPNAWCDGKRTPIRDGLRIDGTWEHQRFH